MAFLSFFTFSHALLVSIPSPKYHSKMTNPLFFQYAFVTSSRQSRIAVHAYKNDTQVYYYYIMSPVSPVFHTEVIVSIGLKHKLRVGTSIPQYQMSMLVGRVLNTFLIILCKSCIDRIGCKVAQSLDKGSNITIVPRQNILANWDCRDNNYSHAL